MMQFEDVEKLRDSTQANKARIETENHTREALIDLAAAHQAENELLKNRILRLEDSLKKSREFSEMAAKYAGRGIDHAHKLAKFKKDRRKGSDVIHIEHRAMKEEVFTWLDSQSKFKSIESAATEIRKQQPIAHVTGRDWYKEWKKLRAASTP